MLDCVPPFTAMKALVEKLDIEKPPFLHGLIKKISNVLSKAVKEEIRPFLDHLFDSFKFVSTHSYLHLPTPASSHKLTDFYQPHTQLINDANPDVRKNVVFCIVDL